MTTDVWGFISGLSIVSLFINTSEPHCFNPGIFVVSLEIKVSPPTLSFPFKNVLDIPGLL